MYGVRIIDNYYYVNEYLEWVTLIDLQILKKLVKVDFQSVFCNWKEKDM
jgi:hypothetical protein